MTDVLIVGGVFREVLIGPLGREVRLAGSGLYAALAAARAGADVELVAPVGDEDRATAQALCDGVGVRPHWLSVGAESATFVLDAAWWRVPRPQYKPAGAPQRLRSRPEGAGVVLMFGHPEWQPDLDDDLAALTADAELLWDREGWLSRSALRPHELIAARARVLLGNTGELAHVVAAEPADVDASEPPDSFVAWVIKDGPWGVHTRERGQPLVSVAAWRVRPRSSIGSGDVFAGALAAARAQGISLPEACQSGALAAAEALTSSDPLSPEPLADPSMRPPLAPSRRKELRARLSAGPRWAAEALANELTGALGLMIDAAPAPGSGDLVQLEVESRSGSSVRGEVTASGWDELVEQLALAGLDLAAEALGAEVRRLPS